MLCGTRAFSNENARSWESLTRKRMWEGGERCAVPASYQSGSREKALEVMSVSVAPRLRGTW